MVIADLYRERVLDHNRAPRRFGPLDGATGVGCARRVQCGDDLRVALRVDDGRIVGYGFEGEGCAVAVAAASMLGDLLVGAPRDHLAALRRDFDALLGGAAPSAALGELAALAGLATHPARQGCALLAFEAAADALAGQRGGTAA
jgi:nitrogen fixation NifU-like protein